jgi:hypothetical protein
MGRQAKATGCRRRVVRSWDGGYSCLPPFSLVRSAHSRPSTQMQSLLRHGIGGGIRELADYTYQRVELLSLLTPGGGHTHT